MHLRRTAIIAAVLLALSTSAGAVVVFDPLNTLEHSFLNGWRESIGAVLTQQLDRVRQMAKRLSAFTNLAKYVASAAPLWRTSRIADALAASDAFMDALNGGDQTGRGYAAVARSRVPVGAAFAEFGEENVVAENALRAALATLDIADSVIMAGADQTGRIRGNRRSEVSIIAALESDVIDGDQEQSTTAVLDKMSAASLIRARQQETRMELLTALTEQLLVDSKRDRDTEAAAMNMQLGRLNRGGAGAGRLLAGAADDFRSWRQPLFLQVNGNASRATSSHHRHDSASHHEPAD